MFLCETCAKVFTSKKNLNAHIKSKHREKTNERFTCVICNKPYEYQRSLAHHIRVVHQNLGSTNVQFSCNECGYKTKYKNHLTRHISKLHISNNQNDTSETKCFQCKKCNANYKYKRTLWAHEVKAHERKKTKKIKPLKCPKCPALVKKRNDMYRHFEMEHACFIEKENYEFQNNQEFDVWKKEVERKTNSSFLKVNKTMTFQCHRSGTYEPAGKGIRRLKLSGSRKINGFCPAMIKVEKQSEHKVEVTYIKTHVGHECEIKHLRLTKKEKKLLAGKVPSGEIFKGIRGNLSDKQLHVTNLEDISLDCSSGFQEYMCTPLDNCIKNNMCKHIHLVAKSNSTVECIPELEAVNEVVISDVMSEISSKDLIPLEDRRKLVLSKLDELKEVVLGINTSEGLKCVEDALIPIKPTLDLLEETQLTSYQVRVNSCIVQWFKVALFVLQSISHYSETFLVY